MAGCAMPCCASDRWCIVDVPSDGDCFFSALVGKPNAHNLRTLVCNAANFPPDHALRVPGEWFDTHIVPLETVAKVLGAPIAVRNLQERTWQTVFPNEDVTFECVPPESYKLLAGGYHFMRVEPKTASATSMTVPRPAPMPMPMPRWYLNPSLAHVQLGLLCIAMYIAPRQPCKYTRGRRLTRDRYRAPRLRTHQQVSFEDVAVSQRKSVPIERLQ